MSVIKCPVCGESDLLFNENIIQCKACNSHFTNDYINSISNQLETILNNNTEIDLGKLRYLVKYELNEPRWNVDLIKKYCMDILSNYPEDIISNFLLKFLDRSNFRANYTKYLVFLKNASIQEYELNYILPLMISKCEVRDKDEVEDILKSKGLYDKYKAKLDESIALRQKEIDLYDPNLQRDVFICHAHEDINVVEEIDKALIKETFESWYSERNTPQDNVNYWNDIYAAIDNCKLFLLILSNNSLASKDVLAEIRYAKKINKELRIEYRIDNVDNSRAFKEYFTGQWIDASSFSNINKLVDVIYDLLSEKEEVKEEKKKEEPKKEDEKDNTNTFNINFDAIKEEKQTDYQKELIDSFFPNDTENEAIKGYIEQGNYFFLKQEYEAAIDYYYKASKLNSKKAILLMAKAKMNLGKYEDALQNINEINNDVCPEANYLQGMIYLALADRYQNRNNYIKLAIEYLYKAANQQYPKSFYILGDIFYTGKYNVSKDVIEATRYFKKAASINNSDACYKLALILSDGKICKPNYQEAYTYLNQAVNAGNKDAIRFLITKLAIGDSFIKKDIDKAISLANHFETIVDPTIKHDLATYLYQNKKYDEALKFFLQLNDINSKYLTAYIYYTIYNRSEDAIKLLKPICDDNKNHLNKSYNSCCILLGNIYKAKKKYKIAKSYFNLANYKDDTLPSGFKLHMPKINKGFIFNLLLTIISITLIILDKNEVVDIPTWVIVFCWFFFITTGLGTIGALLKRKKINN